MNTTEWPGPITKRDKYHEGWARGGEIRMLSTLSELRANLPTEGNSDADKLLRALPDTLMLGAFFSNERGAPLRWEPVAWTEFLSDTHDQFTNARFVRLHSPEFRQYLMRVFFESEGRVLRTERREELISLLSALIDMLNANRDLEEGLR